MFGFKILSKGTNWESNWTNLLSLHNKRTRFSFNSKINSGGQGLLCLKETTLPIFHKETNLLISLKGDRWLLTLFYPRSLKSRKREASNFILVKPKNQIFSTRCLRSQNLFKRKREQVIFKSSCPSWRFKILILRGLLWRKYPKQPRRLFMGKNLFLRSSLKFLTQRNQIWSKRKRKKSSIL